MLAAIAAIMVSIVRSIGGYKPPFPIPEKQSAYHPRAQRNASRHRDARQQPDCSSLRIHSAIPVEQGEMETVTEAVINRQLAGSPTPFLFTHIKRVAAIIAGLSFLLVGLWFGISTRHTPQSRYPYYDTQKPVPQWSEPMPLKGNLR